MGKSQVSCFFLTHSVQPDTVIAKLRTPPTESEVMRMITIVYGRAFSLEQPAYEPCSNVEPRSIDFVIKKQNRS